MTPNMAGFWRRLAAALIDGFILLIINLSLTSFASIFNNRFVSVTMGLLFWVISVFYYIYFIGSKGQTPGKMALKIQVVRVDNQPMTYTTAFVRETLGKFLSGFIFSLGYLWMIWDKNKQTWHDKLAKTQVIKK